MRPNALLLFIAVIHTMPVMGYTGMSAQSSPEALAQQLLQAIRSRSASQARALIDEETTAEIERLDPGAADRAIAGWLRRDFPDDTRIQIQQPEELKGYDASEHAVLLGTTKLQFPKRPDRVLTLSHREKRPNGMRVQSVMVALINRNGNWRVLLAAYVRPAAEPYSAE